MRERKQIYVYVAQGSHDYCQAGKGDTAIVSVEMWHILFIVTMQPFSFYLEVARAHHALQRTRQKVVVKVSTKASERQVLPGQVTK